MLYQALVAKRTGRLAASARAHVEIGGVRKDRWIGELVVGGAGPRGEAFYAASHEFGHDVVVDHEVIGHAKAAHDLNSVLEELGSV